MSTSIKTIGILGAGAWGTALAEAAASAGCDVVLHAIEKEVVASISEVGENRLFLPGVKLNERIRATGDVADAIWGADLVLAVMPAQFLRSTLGLVAKSWKAGVPIVLCSKGIEQNTGKLMSEVAAEALPDAPALVLSGPTFASEVARGLPTGAMLAGKNPALVATVADAIGTRTFRLYYGTDVIGAEIGGAVKNVIAVACGIVEGKKLGDNARATLITRGLAEIVRLAEAKGGRPETLMGLAGVGDLVLTCNAMQSRNFSFGVEVGRGLTVAAIEAERKTVAEGVHTAAATVALAETLGVDMPIVRAVDGVLNHGLVLDDAIQGLLSRPVGEE